MKKTYLSFVLLALLLCLQQAIAQVPPGYYNGTSGQSGDQLKSTLYHIIKGHTEYPYSSSSTDVWDILKETDRDPNNTSNVIGLYSGFSMNAAKEYDNGAGWNREHVWAKSRGDFGTTLGPGTDLHHLRAADVSTNSARNNRSFANEADDPYVDGSGNYSGPTGSFTSSDWVWEPRSEVKGDVARMIFYMATRYEGFNGEPDLELVESWPSNTDKSSQHGSLSALLQWHTEDPVDDRERNRNNIIYHYQGNRNPYIDHPGFVNLIWGGGTYSSFTSIAVTNATENQLYTYNISASGSSSNLTFSSTTQPNWLTLTDNGNGTATLSGTPSLTDIGSANVTLVVTDGSGSDTQSFTITVNTESNGGSTNELFFSEYIEGSSYNKSLEIANLIGTSINLSNYTIKKQTNGYGDWSAGLSLSGTLADGDVFVIVHSSANAALQAKADLINSGSEMSFNGNDPIGLFKNGSLVDVIGTFNAGSTNFAKDVTLVRITSSGNITYTASEWDNHPIDTFDFIGVISAPTDIHKPTAPSGLLISNLIYDLSWNASTDDEGVVAYDVYQDGAFLASTSTTSYSISGLTSGTSYSFYIIAKDSTGNESSSSNTLSITTVVP